MKSYYNCVFVTSFCVTYELQKVCLGGRGSISWVKVHA